MNKKSLDPFTSLFVVFAILVGCDGGGNSGNSIVSLNDDSNAIPTNSTYNIQITGEVFFSGVASGEPFTLNAALAITPGIDRVGLTDNGVNPIDVGIFTGESPIAGVAGALYFGSNTSLSSLVGSNLGASALDVSFVEIDAALGTVTVTVDGNVFGLPTARLNTFNIYNARTSVLAQIHNVLAGTVTINFSNNASTVGGEIQLGGSSGFSGAGITSEYYATFSGERSS